MSLLASHARHLGPSSCRCLAPASTSPADLEQTVVGLAEPLSHASPTESDLNLQTKVRDATSNDAWGPSGTQMNEIAQLTYNQCVTSLPFITSWLLRVSQRSRRRATDCSESVGARGSWPAAVCNGRRGSWPAPPLRLGGRGPVALAVSALSSGPAELLIAQLLLCC